MVGRQLFLGLVAFVLMASSASAQSVEKGQSICYEVQSTVNTIVGSIETTCFPAKGREGAHSFILVASQSVFSIELKKKLWLLVAVGSVGKTLNEQPSLSVDEILLSDANLMKSSIAYAIPASLAKSLQKRVHDDQIDTDEMYALIIENLEQKVFSR